MHYRFFSLILAIQLLFLSSSHVFAQQTVDRILVVVNDEIITESDLRHVLAPIHARLQATLTGHELDQKLDESRDFYLKQLVDDRLVIAAAKEMGIQVKESEVDEMVDEMRAKFPTQEAFEAALSEQLVSFKDLRQRFTNEILKRRMVDIKVRSRISVSPGEVWEYYQENPGRFRGEPEVRVTQILIRDGDAHLYESAEGMARFIIDELDKGMDMATLAKEYSGGAEADQGGDMGWVRQGQFMERIDRAIFQLNEGEYTEPIKTQLGYHIFKVEDMRESVKLPFEEVKDRARKLVYRIKTEKLLGDWLEELKSTSYIAYRA